MLGDQRRELKSWPCGSDLFVCRRLLLRFALGALPSALSSSPSALLRLQATLNPFGITTAVHDRVNVYGISLDSIENGERKFPG